MNPSLLALLLLAAPAFAAPSDAWKEFARPGAPEQYVPYLQATLHRAH